MAECTRPVLRYHGGKWRLAPWIISHFPPHRVYTEAFGGAGSVLMRKPRAYSEVYNDLDGELVNLFRVLRTRGGYLAEQLALTPFSRTEFEESYKPVLDPIEQARRTVIRSFMGFGSNAHNQRTGFRANSNRSNTTPAHDWGNYPDSLRAVIERLKGVVIECRPALSVILQHDGPETLHYVDPPYPKGTRKDGRDDYAHEMKNDQHCELAEVLHTVSGMVVISGYACEMYDADLYPDWHRVTRAAMADGARARTEVLWLNDAAAAHLAPTLDLNFTGAA